jgi:hypothetical protein
MTCDARSSPGSGAGGTAPLLVPGAELSGRHQTLKRSERSVRVMPVLMPLKAKYRHPRAYKNVGAQNHTNSVVHKRRTVDNRKRTGTGRDWYH